MTPVEIVNRLDIVRNGNDLRVNARESSDLEFKLELNLVAFKKSLKTIAAFANKMGGCIIFGVQDRPRLLIGIGNADLDEGHQSEQLVQSLSPVPDARLLRIDVFDKVIAALVVSPTVRAPVIAIKELQGAAGEEIILRQGMVYTRRRGQTSAISGEEFSQLLISRDNLTRKEIFSYLDRGKSIGFDKVVVADPGGVDGENAAMTFFLPASAAKDLNVIDRARLVESDGAPAYEIQGSVQLTVPNVNDPRQPLRAVDSAELLGNDIKAVFWPDLPWSYNHLKKAAQNLGFWANEDGDQTHTGREQLTGTTIYYAAGRAAILNFARQNPSAFIEAVGSVASIAHWRGLQQQA